MEVLLTERLVCPRCGPAFGLILLADRVVDRRALEGSLGCPNCRDRFPIREGFADLRVPPRDELPPWPESDLPPDPTEALRLAALLAVTSGPSRVVLLGPAALHAAGLAGMIPELEVISISRARVAGSELPGVTRMATGPGLPFQNRAIQGIVLSGQTDTRLLEEAARTVAPGARVVVLGAPSGIRAEAEATGLHVLLEQDGVLVAERTSPRAVSGGRRLPVV